MSLVSQFAQQASGFKNINSAFKKQVDVAKHGDLHTVIHDKDFVKQQLQDPAFKHFADRAYASEEGYAIRVNPYTGEKEMFVAGTKNLSQWGLNLVDTGLVQGDEALTIARNDLLPFLSNRKNVKFFERLDIPRQRKQKLLSKIAQDESIRVVYGHSRGGAIVADMRVDADKIGLDAAMIIASNKDMTNYEEGAQKVTEIRPLTWMDEAIGLTGKDNVHMDMSWKPHQVWTNSDE